MEEVKTVIRDMKNNNSVGGVISIQTLKSEFTVEILTNCIKKPTETGCFQDSLKEANITPFFKKTMIHLINLITGQLAFYL